MEHYNNSENPMQNNQALDIAVVGPCSAGKSTLVANLKKRGFGARAISQEHSYVPYMWQMRQPDVLIYLDISLPILRVRRQPDWPSQLLDLQKNRLTHAREHCDLYISTDNLIPEQVVDQAQTFLDGFDPTQRAQLDQPELLRRVHMKIKEEQ